MSDSTKSDPPQTSSPQSERDTTEYPQDEPQIVGYADFDGDGYEDGVHDIAVSDLDQNGIPDGFSIL
ncbi:UNVERIFIED_CONTAM: hypothetical protein DES50_10759 [Williamsia faeni]